jgi:hypothetical protein
MCVPEGLDDGSQAPYLRDGSCLPFTRHFMPGLRRVQSSRYARFVPSSFVVLNYGGQVGTQASLLILTQNAPPRAAFHPGYSGTKRLTSASTPCCAIFLGTVIEENAM